MRKVFYVDTKIGKEEFAAFEKMQAKGYKRVFGFEPVNYVVWRDFSDYPTRTDKDGDVSLDWSFMSGLSKEVEANYKDDGTDYVSVLIHQDNWKSGTKLWGTAWAYSYGPYLYTKNMVNTNNTVYHEDLHPLDALIKKELGIDINPILEQWLRKEYADVKSVISYLDKKGFNFDRDLVHGNLKPPFAYIGRRGGHWNEDAIIYIRPYITQAFAKRKARHDKVFNQMQRHAISLLSTIISFFQKK